MPSYRAKVGLTVPVDQKEADRLQKLRESGHPLPSQARKMTRVNPGQIAKFIPAQSIGWMLAQGYIEEVV